MGREESRGRSASVKGGISRKERGKTTRHDSSSESSERSLRKSEKKQSHNSKSQEHHEHSSDNKRYHDYNGSKHRKSDPESKHQSHASYYTSSAYSCSDLESLCSRISNIAHKPAGPPKSPWRFAIRRGTVILNVELSSETEFITKFEIRRENESIMIQEPADVYGSDLKVRTFAIQLASYMRELSKAYGSCLCFTRTFPDEHEFIGTVKDIKTGKVSASLQIHPHPDHDLLLGTIYLVHVSKNAETEHSKHSSAKVHHKHERDRRESVQKSRHASDVESASSSSNESRSRHTSKSRLDKDAKAGKNKQENHHDHHEDDKDGKRGRSKSRDSSKGRKSEAGKSPTGKHHDKERSQSRSKSRRRKSAENDARKHKRDGTRASSSGGSESEAVMERSRSRKSSVAKDHKDHAEDGRKGHAEDSYKDGADDKHKGHSAAKNKRRNSEERNHCRSHSNVKHKRSCSRGRIESTSKKSHQKSSMSDSDTHTDEHSKSPHAHQKNHKPTKAVSKETHSRSRSRHRSPQRNRQHLKSDSETSEHQRGRRQSDTSNSSNGAEFESSAKRHSHHSKHQKHAQKCSASKSDKESKPAKESKRPSSKAPDKMRRKSDGDRSPSLHEKKKHNPKHAQVSNMNPGKSREHSLGSEVRASISCHRLAPSELSDSDASFETVIIVRSRSRSRRPKHKAIAVTSHGADSKDGKNSASEAAEKTQSKHTDKSAVYEWDQVTFRNHSKDTKKKHSNHADEKSRSPDHPHSGHGKKKAKSETTSKSDTQKTVKQHASGRSRSHSRNSRIPEKVHHDKSKLSERSASSSSTDSQRDASSSGHRKRSTSRSHSARHTDDERNKSQTRKTRKSSAGDKAYSRGSSQHSKQERHRQSSHSSSSLDSYSSDKTPQSDAHRHRSRSRRGAHKLPAVLTFLDLENYFLFTDPHSQNESASDSESRIEKRVSFKKRSVNSSSTQHSHSEAGSHSKSRDRDSSYSHSESPSESDAPYYSESESLASEYSHSHRSSSESNLTNGSAKCDCRKGEGCNGTFNRILEDTESNSSYSEEMHPSDSCSNVSSSDHQSESHFSDSLSESSGSTPRASHEKDKSAHADHGILPSIASIHRHHDSDPGSGEIIIPTNLPSRDSTIPAEEISLEFIHGYRSKDVSNNAYYLNENTIIFPAGSIGVVMCLKTNTQRFFQGRHKQEISALCIHPSKKLVATGDAISTSESCYIYVWDPKEPEDVQRMVQIRVGDRKLAGGVIDAQFSSCGKFLAAVSMDFNHHVYVYNWQKAGKLIAKESGHKHVIFGLCFNPLVSHEFITFGVRHITFWKLDVPKGQLSSVQGVFRTDEIPSILSSAYLPNAQVLTGTQKGQVLLWEKHQIVKVIELAAQGPVFSINTSSKLGILVGGKDGILVRFDANSFEKIASMKTPSAIKSLDASGHGKILVGFEGSELIEITELSAKDAVLEKSVARTLLQGHSVSQNDKLRVGATNPTNEYEYSTVGDDSAVYVRNLKSKATVAKTYLQGKLRAASYSPDGKYIAVGNANGDIFIVKSNDLAQAHFQKYEKRDDVKTNFHAINVIKFSPNGKYLAAGSSDHVVYLFELSDGFKKTHTFRGHSGSVMCLDWSVRSDFLRSDSGAEIMHWSISDGAHVKLEKNVEWSSWTCIGMESHNRNDDVHTCCRSPNKEIIVSGTNAGFLTLQTFPSDHLLPYKQYSGHGSAVSSVSFNSNGRYLISTGSSDGCTFEWRVQGPK